MTRPVPADAVLVAKSTNCGATFAKPAVVTGFIPYSAQDVSSPQPGPSTSAPDDPLLTDAAEAAGSSARDCGDFEGACRSGYTFFRRVTSPRASADQRDSQREWVYIVFDATKPGTQVATNTTYGSVQSGTGSQSGIYFVRLDGQTGAVTSPTLIDDQKQGHQFFGDISADGGYLHAVWWDSRSDPYYSPARPVGNDATGKTYPSVDAWVAKSTDGGAHWTAQQRLSTATSNPNYEQFSNRTVPFAGDYLWITSVGSVAFAGWTDWRDVIAGVDQREPGSTDSADVKQCRTYDAATMTWSSDQCPRAGGLNQNIYGSIAP